VWKKTQERLKEIEKGYTLVVMHECEVYDQNNAELCGYIARRQMFHKNKRVHSGTITPRDAFLEGKQIIFGSFVKLIIQMKILNTLIFVLFILLSLRIEITRLGTRLL
jgi:hypothetical protein